MASSCAALVTLLVTSCAAMAVATTYDVGGQDKDWAIGVDYSNWTIGKSFAVGDELVFNYGRTQHTVTEVNQSDYASCSRTSALVVRNDFGQTTVTLTTPGTHYYICVIPGHCAGGMKLAVTVAAAGSGPGPSSEGGVTPSGASQRVPAMGIVVAAAAGALVMSRCSDRWTSIEISVPSVREEAVRGLLAVDLNFQVELVYATPLSILFVTAISINEYI